MARVRSVLDNSASLSVATTRCRGLPERPIQPPCQPRPGPRPGYSPAASAATNAAGRARSRRLRKPADRLTPGLEPEAAQPRGQPSISLVLEPQAQLPQRPRVRPQGHRGVETQRAATTRATTPLQIRERSGRKHNADKPSRASPLAPSVPRGTMGRTDRPAPRRRRPRTTKGIREHPRTGPARPTNPRPIPGPPRPLVETKEPQRAIA